MHPPTCNCGTELPEGARFCFRCGKPQRAEDIETFAPAAIPTPPPLPVATEIPTGVSFANPVALRTALFIACLITGLEMLPFPFLLIAPVMGGFAAVTLFQRRTRRVLTTTAAAKLGWMTASLNTLLGTIALTVSAVVEGFGPLRDAIRQQPASPSQQQTLQLMNDPYMFALLLLMVWIFVVVVISGLCIAGGALGARLARPRTS